METIKLTIQKKENTMKENTFTNLLEAVLTSKKSTAEMIDMLELLRKMKSSQKLLDNSDAVLMGTKLHYLRTDKVEELA